MRFTKRVVAQGHVTVPSDLRSALGIDAGDLVEFQVVGVVRRLPAASNPIPTNQKPTPEVSTA